MQAGCAAWLSKLHWRTLILTLALLTIVNLVFLNDTLRRPDSTEQGQQSLKNSNTRIEVADTLMLLGKAGIQELEGTQLDEAGIQELEGTQLDEAGPQEVELTETQLGKAGLQKLEATRTSLALKSTVVAAPTNHLGINPAVNLR
ncbi:hypothetical protein O988_04453 [Pseudogymnoascus sp. VKM F-3808]|nr:hypothetical protein O988_04453 [Pseudogymnoascus sp. VKM F-3808]